MYDPLFRVLYAKSDIREVDWILISLIFYTIITLT